MPSRTSAHVATEPAIRGGSPATEDWDV
jgi:hypothetical protein